MMPLHIHLEQLPQKKITPRVGKDIEQLELVHNACGSLHFGKLFGSIYRSWIHPNPKTQKFYSYFILDRRAYAHQKKCTRMILVITCHGPKLQIIYMPTKSRIKNIFWFVHIEEYHATMTMSGPRIHEQ